MKQLIPIACGLLLAACADRDTATVLSEAAGDVQAPGDAIAAGDKATGGAYCAADEEVVFGCATGPERIVALCAAPGLSRLQYREASADGSVALAWPEDDTAPSQAFRSGTLMYSGGGGAFLRFDIEGRTYTAYTGIGRGWEKAGVLVQEGGDTVRSLSCGEGVVSMIGPELFERAGIPGDAEGFEIP